MSKLFGYARVSSRDQNLNRQFDALMEFGVEKSNIYADTASGYTFERPAYHSLVQVVTPGDVIAVKSIDRLGRNYDEILEEWRRLTKALECSVVVLDMPILDTRSTCNDLTGVLISDIVLQLLSYVAQIERENIRQRQAEGIASARARGVRFGRPPKQRPSNYLNIKHAYLEGAISKRDAAKRLNVCSATLDKWFQQDKR